MNQYLVTKPASIWPLKPCGKNNGLARVNLLLKKIPSIMCILPNAIATNYHKISSLLQIYYAIVVHSVA